VKIVLSRKGFDSAAGGVPNPIMPDGTLVRLPIPRREDRKCFRDVRFRRKSIGKLVKDLTGGRLSGRECVHLDPDIRRGALPRARGWRPLFGQRGAALAHLRKQGVGIGDVFLFFGWFREAELAGGAYRYTGDAAGMHVIFGWLQPGRIMEPGDKSTAPRWAQYHPHFDYGGDGGLIFAAAQRLSLPGLDADIPGGGMFKRFDPMMRLTAPGSARRSHWLLPRWMKPAPGQPPLTYHHRPERWRECDDGVILESVGRGQEFVLHAEHYPESGRWLARFFTKLAVRGCI